MDNAILDKFVQFWCDEFIKIKKFNPNGGRMILNSEDMAEYFNNVFFNEYDEIPGKYSREECGIVFEAVKRKLEKCEIPFYDIEMRKLSNLKGKHRVDISLKW